MFGSHCSAPGSNHCLAHIAFRARAQHGFGIIAVGATLQNEISAESVALTDDKSQIMDSGGKLTIRICMPEVLGHLLVSLLFDCRVP